MALRFIHSQFVLIMAFFAVGFPALIAGQENPAALLEGGTTGQSASAAGGHVRVEVGESLRESPAPNLPDAPDPQAAAADAAKGSISGTVTDTNGDLVPGATVVLEAAGVKTTMAADDNGQFTFVNLAPGLTYRMTVTAKAFQDWSSPPIAVASGAVVF